MRREDGGARREPVGQVARPESYPQSRALPLRFLWITAVAYSVRMTFPSSGPRADQDQGLMNLIPGQATVQLC